MRNPHEDDQPDAMNQGVHIALGTYWSRVTCECGERVPVDLWEMHCESEGE